MVLGLVVVVIIAEGDVVVDGVSSNTHEERSNHRVRNSSRHRLHG